jgi:hypothetical protein
VRPELLEDELAEPAQISRAAETVAPGGEAVFEVNGWTVTVRPVNGS